MDGGWLVRNKPSRKSLTVGDEFGCYGIPGLEWSIDPGAVAAECRIISNLERLLPSGLNLHLHLHSRLCPDVWSH